MLIAYWKGLHIPRVFILVYKTNNCGKTLLRVKISLYKLRETVQ